MKICVIETVRRKRDVPRKLSVVALVACLSAVTSVGFCADCNGTGVDDLQDILRGFSEDCNQNFLPDECESIPIEFGLDSTRAYPLRGTPRAVTIADMDGNGHDDVITASRETDTPAGPSVVSVLLGQGNRSFVHAGDRDVGRRLYGISTADLNGDGFLDVLVADRRSRLSSRLYTLFGNGDGTLSEAVEYRLNGDVRSVTTGDLNGDLAVDVVVPFQGGREIGVLLNRADGTGTLGEVRQYTTGISPQEVVIADYSGDGILDVAVVNRNRNSPDVSVLINQDDGNGSLSELVSYPVSISEPTNLKSGDLDADGFVDLIAFGVGGGGVLLNQGDGTFGEVTVFDIGDGLGSQYALADVDSDGDIDVVGTEPPGRFTMAVEVAINDGSAGFDVVRRNPIGHPPLFLGTADFDDDGGADLVVSLLGESGVTFLWNRDGAGPRVSLSSQTIPLGACPRGRCRPHGATVGDFNGDGFTDFLVTNTHPGTCSVLLSDGVDGLKHVGTHFFGGEQPLAVAAGDVDGDGDIDAASVEFQSQRLYIHINNGDATFEPPRKFPVGSGSIHVQLGDLDRDGDLDAVTANKTSNSVSTLFNRGDGTFFRQSLVDLRVKNDPMSVAVGDLNGDGWGDVVAGSASVPFVTVLLNAEGPFRMGTFYALSGNSHHVTTFDIDGDGHLDIAIANQTRGSCSLLYNRGDGSGTFGEPEDFAIGRKPYSVKVLDFNGDGPPDLLAVSEVLSSVSIRFGNGNGTFQIPVHFETGSGPRFLGAGDFDGDGDFDLAINDRVGESVTVLTQEGSVADRTTDFLENICTPLDFHVLSVVTAGDERERFVKYLLPVRDDPKLLPVMFQNTRRFLLHQDFFVDVFPERFPGLTTEEYTSLVGRRASRDYFVGAITRLRTKPGLTYGFSVFADFADPGEALSAEEVEEIYRRLQASFRLTPLAYAPLERNAVEVALEWEDPSFPVVFPRPPPSYVPYTRGVGYGRVRLLGADEFAEANQQGRISFQDVVVTAIAPRDIEGVTAGVITAEPQGELSHVAIRTARRGTPNAFVKEALEVFAPWAGRLVRLEVADEGFEVQPATPEEAAAFWENNQPTLSVLPTLDANYKDFPTLIEAAQLDIHPGEPSMESRIGGKATQLARLQRSLTGEWEQYAERGFGIPMHYYLEFMHTNTTRSEIDGRSVTYQEYLEELFDLQEFPTDSELRFLLLDRFRGLARSGGQIPDELVTDLMDRIQEVFGSHALKVRFRSSSNVEDGLEFNGAGLYDSTSVCPPDELDNNATGPSLCDVSKETERTIARALKRVWTSLWNFRAYEERAFYGLDPGVAAMGILVNRAFVDEQVNGVAFTGNPTNAFDRRYVISAQIGENSVVSPEPGQLPEKDILDMGPDGQVATIIRAARSTLVPRGTFVLSDDQLRELGRLMWHMDHDFPIDTGRYSRADLLLDLEFKITAEGDLAVKQVRPFLLSDSGERPPTFELVIPPEAIACGAFRLGRELPVEYNVKSELRFVAGTFSLPTWTSTFSANLVEEVVFGPEQSIATPTSDGLFRVRQFSVEGDITYTFEYEQELSLPNGDTFRLNLAQLDFAWENGEAVDGGRQTLDESLLLGDLFVGGSVDGAPALNDITYTSCTLESLPLWEMEIELEEGASLRLEERYLPMPRATGPAQLTRALVFLGGAQREITSYWDLVHTASRHNERREYWVVLNPPMTVPGLDEPVHVVEYLAPEPREGFEAVVNYLGEAHQILGQPEILSIRREEVPERFQEFRRGDVSADGALETADAISILLYLFSAGDEPTCLKAGDANDDGKLNLSDAVRVLLHLYRGVGLPPPFETCGSDLTADGLGCQAFVACE